MITLQNILIPMLFLPFQRVATNLKALERRRGSRWESGLPRSLCALTLRLSFLGDHSDTLPCRASYTTSFTDGGVCASYRDDGRGSARNSYIFRARKERQTNTPREPDSPGSVVFGIKRNVRSVISTWAESCEWQDLGTIPSAAPTPPVRFRILAVQHTPTFTAPTPKYARHSHRNTRHTSVNCTLN